MLEGLEEIDWNSLNHAYGSAGDIPHLLRERASSDPEVAKNAEAEFFGNIWHQGTVYQATAPTVPFLVELLMRRETCERAGLVLLLASIAKGSSFLEVHQDFPHYAKDAGKAEVKEKLAMELDWKALARKAVADESEKYWTLLDDPAVWVAIPYLLSKLPCEAERVCATARNLIGAWNDDLFDASLLFGWVWCARAGAQTEQPFVSFLRGAGVPLRQLGGALGVLQFGTHVADIKEALGIYFDALQRSSSYQPDDHKWLWGEGDLNGLLLGWLSRFGRPANEVLAACLPTTLSGMDNYTAGDLAAETLHLGFDRDHLPASKADLTSLQMSLLTGLVRYTNIIHSDPLILAIQRALGLPNDLKRLKAFLENA